MIMFDDLRPGPDGLVPAIVRDTTTGDVAMVAYMDAEALDATQRTGLVHFHSRRRNALWMKGETSGNTLALSAITPDCDSDALLVEATPAGPVCHTGAATCFTVDTPDPAAITGGTGFGATIDRLVEIVRDRATADPTTSYSARLIGDPDLAARKVLEEAGEVAFAVKDLPDGAPARVVEEAADLTYHLIALLAAAGVPAGDVADELRRRMEPPAG